MIKKYKQDNVFVGACKCSKQLSKFAEKAVTSTGLTDLERMIIASGGEIDR